MNDGINKEVLLRQLQDLGAVMRITTDWKEGKYTAGVAMEQIYYVLVEEN